MAQKIQLRRGNASEWSSANPVLSDGEMGLDTTAKRFKVGNGSTAWNSLDYETTAVNDYSVTVPTSGWTGTDPVSITVTVNGITSSDIPLVDLDVSGITYANLTQHNTDFGKVYRVDSTTNGLTFYATGTPTLAIPIKVRVIK
jgi:hypothetical protein